MAGASNRRVNRARPGGTNGQHLSASATSKGRKPEQGLAKCSTGITGLDEVTYGGIPRGRPTLVCGGPGCGKSLMAVEFLIRGVTEYNEPGVLITFEETAEEIAKNVASLGFDIDDLVARNKLSVDYVHVERSEIEETGDYDLEGLFVRIGYAVDKVKARRIVLDTIESLFAGLGNAAILRAELRRLFRWLKDRGLTAIITGERGERTLTRQGLEEYVSDCVVLLDHRVSKQISTRRLRVVKYRGSIHGTNEYPFLIDEDGMSVLPITSIGLNHGVSTERMSSGVGQLDEMLGGGFYRGSSVLISGTAGTGKSSLCAHLAEAACARGEKVIYFAFEEPSSQIIRNMRSIGIALEPHARKGLLNFFNVRPSYYGLEMHLAMMHKHVSEVRPTVVIIDPISNLLQAAAESFEATAMVTRLVDYLKGKTITAMFTSLTHGGTFLEATDLTVSSIMDTWLLLRDIELGGERNRGMYILKSRGMAHSNQIREFLLTDKGVELRDVYVGPSGVLTGSSRLIQEAQEQADQIVRRDEIESKHRQVERRRKALDAQIAALQADFDAERDELERIIAQEKTRERRLAEDRVEMAISRRAGGAKPAPVGRTRRPAGRRRGS